MFTLLVTAGKLTFAPVGSWPLVTGAAVLLALLTAYVYSRPRGESSGSKRRLLVALRVSAFACLALAMLRPSVNVTSEESRRLKVLVLVDGSASMGVPYLPGAERGSVASRAEVAAEFSKALLERLPRRFERQLFVFSDTLAEIDPGELAAAAELSGPDVARQDRSPRGGPGTGSPETGSPEPLVGSPRSGLGPALTEAGRRVGSSPAAVVLVSDGAATYGPDPSGVARALPFPVYTVTAAEEGSFRDVEVSDVLSPATGFTGSDVPVLVRLKGRGLENLTVPVTITESNVPVSGGNVTLAGAAHSELLLSVRPATAGVHFYEVRVPGVAGEISGLNNVKRFAVEAVSEKLKVLYLEGGLTWDFRFLKRTLESDPRLETAFWLVGGWRAGSPNARNVSVGTPPGLAGTAVVIVGDGAAVHVPPALWQAMAEFVSSGGGILFAGVDGLARAPAGARELLPVVLKPQDKWGPPRLLDVELTARGLDHPVCQVENDPALVGKSWEDVSPLLGVAAVDRAKPEASVLLEGRSDGEAWPLLVAGSFGKGRALLAGAGGLWRWGFTLPGLGGSKRLYPGLVSNAVSWLSETGAERKFAVLPARWVFESGEDVRFLVRGVDDTSAVKVEVTAADGTTSAATGAARGAAGGSLEPAAGHVRSVEVRSGAPGGGAPSFGALEPGAYSYTASGFQAGRPLSFRGTFVVDTTGAEDRSLFPDPRLLAYVAQASGGKHFVAGDPRSGRVDEGELDRLVREIGAFGEKVAVERQVRLWSHPLLLILFACALASEWWLRRRWGLP